MLQAAVLACRPCNVTGSSSARKLCVRQCQTFPEAAGLSDHQAPAGNPCQGRDWDASHAADETQWHAFSAAKCNASVCLPQGQLATVTRPAEAQHVRSWHLHSHPAPVYVQPQIILQCTASQLVKTDQLTAEDTRIQCIARSNRVFFRAAEAKGRSLCP